MYTFKDNRWSNWTYFCTCFLLFLSFFFLLSSHSPFVFCIHIRKCFVLKADIITHVRICNSYDYRVTWSLEYSRKKAEEMLWRKVVSIIARRYLAIHEISCTLVVCLASIHKTNRHHSMTERHHSYTFQWPFRDNSVPFSHDSVAFHWYSFFFFSV